MKFTLHPTEITVRLVSKEVEIYDFPDGRLEIRRKGLLLTYDVFDKLQRVSHAAIMENKRPGEVLAWIKQQQDAQPAPSGGSRRVPTLEPEVRPDERPRRPLGAGRQVPASTRTPEAVGAQIGRSPRRPRLRLTRPD
jgi:hypothetical protein